MRPASLQGFHAGLNHVGRRIEIRLTDLQMNDVSALGLKRSCPQQDFERSLRPQTGHAFGQTQLSWCGNSPARSHLLVDRLLRAMRTQYLGNGVRHTPRRLLEVAHLKVA